MHAFQGRKNQILIFLFQCCLYSRFCSTCVHLGWLVSLWFCFGCLLLLFWFFINNRAVFIDVMDKVDWNMFCVINAVCTRAGQMGFISLTGNNTLAMHCFFILYFYKQHYCTIVYNTLYLYPRYSVCPTMYISQLTLNPRKGPVTSLSGLYGQWFLPPGGPVNQVYFQWV